MLPDKFTSDQMSFKQIYLFNIYFLKNIYIIMVNINSF